MKMFWENVMRYPRFLITSVSGLIFILFNNLFKETKKSFWNQFFLIAALILILFLASFIFTLVLNL